MLMLSAFACGVAAAFAGPAAVDRKWGWFWFQVFFVVLNALLMAGVL